MFKLLHKPTFKKLTPSLCIAKWNIFGLDYMEAHHPDVPVKGGWMYEAS